MRLKQMIMMITTGGVQVGRMEHVDRLLCHL